MVLRWFRHDSKQLQKVDLSPVKVQIDALEARLRVLEAQRGELLEYLERLDRITKRSFRLREQLERLEEKASPKVVERELTRNDILKRFTG